jgi:biopolymer transport protein TolR
MPGSVSNGVHEGSFAAQAGGRYQRGALHRCDAGAAGINVDLPRTNSTPLDSKDQEPVIVSIKKDGSYFINVGGDTQKSASLDTVKGHALRIHRNKPETLFLLEGDAEVAYGKVVTLMAALQGAGIQKIGLVTEPPEK